MGKQRIVVAITGASGAIYGVRLLQALRATGQVQTHLVVSEAGLLTLATEQDVQHDGVAALADVLHPVDNVGSSMASGSWVCSGMVIAPCSMHTLAAVALGLSDNLITRAADVMLKERRRLILMVRETPWNLAHLRHMVSVTEMGGIVYPPLPAFYHRPRTIDQMVDHTVGRVLELLDVPQPDRPVWGGFA